MIDFTIWLEKYRYKSALQFKFNSIGKTVASNVRAYELRFAAHRSLVGSR